MRRIGRETHFEIRSVGSRETLRRITDPETREFRCVRTVTQGAENGTVRELWKPMGARRQCGGWAAMLVVAREFDSPARSPLLG
jgi:hypothetical protein